MQLILRFTSLLILWISTTCGADILRDVDKKSNETRTAVQLDISKYKSVEHSAQEHKLSGSSHNKDSKKSLKSARGFMGEEGYNADRYSANMDDESNVWMPYTLPVQKETNYPSESKREWKRQEFSSADINGNYQVLGYTPDFNDMMMMMYAMKKMDTDMEKPGLLTRILENPTTLVMATFIPASLIVVATLPFLVNFVTNGVTIPPLIPTSAGKARDSNEFRSNVELKAIYESLLDLGEKYVKNPKCFQTVLCDLAREKIKEKSKDNYIKTAFDAGIHIVSDDILDAFGVKPLLTAIKSGRCEDLPCTTEQENSNLSKLMNEIMYNHSQKIKPMKS